MSSVWTNKNMVAPLLDTLAQDAHDTLFFFFFENLFRDLFRQYSQ